MTQLHRLVLAAVTVATIVPSGSGPLAVAGEQASAGPATNPLFTEAKVRNYLPHMTWEEVEAVLQRTDMAIIPLGSIEQHGRHLPLCSDICDAIEVAKLIAQRTDVLVAPSVLLGLSDHHMGFPGTLTLSPPTFEAVVFETAEGLIAHGIRKVMIYNGHGGNSASVATVIRRINQETAATAIDLGAIDVPEEDSEADIPLDWHAGEVETSLMLYLTPPLVDMSRAEKPVLTLPEIAQRVEGDDEASLAPIVEASVFLPKRTGKGASTREMTNTGVVTSGNPQSATAERGQRHVERFVAAAVRFIEGWRRVSP